MPKRSDIHSILIIGAGPIVIGQACEFDYSGTQACKALREEGYEVVLVNSNPATIMTDPEYADRTYIEPLTPEAVETVLERERPALEGLREVLALEQLRVPSQGPWVAVEILAGTELQRIHEDADNQYVALRSRQAHQRQ